VVGPLQLRRDGVAAPAHVHAACRFRSDEAGTLEAPVPPQVGSTYRLTPTSAA
jgi:hypothetical protein